MSRQALLRAIEASQARSTALGNELAALHAQMPDKGVDPLLEERLLIAAIELEAGEQQRLHALLLAHGRRRAWLGIVGGIATMAALFAAIAWVL